MIWLGQYQALLSIAWVILIIISFLSQNIFIFLIGSAIIICVNIIFSIANTLSRAFGGNLLYEIRIDTESHGEDNKEVHFQQDMTPHVKPNINDPFQGKAAIHNFGRKNAPPITVYEYRAHCVVADRGSFIRMGAEASSLGRTEAVNVSRNTIDGRLKRRHAASVARAGAASDSRGPQ